MDFYKNIKYFENGINEFKNKNYEQAEKEFEKGKELFLNDKDNSIYYKEIGNPYLAFMYYYGVGRNVDYEKAWKESHYTRRGLGHNADFWEEHVSSDIISNFIIAKMYFNANYVEKNIDVAFKHFKLIADKWKIEEEISNDYLFNIILNDYNDIDAKYLLALIYFYKAKYKKDKEYLEKVQNIFKNLDSNYEHTLLRDLEKQVKEL